MNKSDVATKFKECLETSKSGLRSQWDNTVSCQAFYSGDSMNYPDYVQFKNKEGKKQKALVSFNKVMPYVDAVSGFLQQNRRIVKYVARVPDASSQEAFSKYANAISSFVRDKTSQQHLESEQDLDMLVCGYGAVETDLSYIQGNVSSSPNGDIIKVRLDPRVTFWDSSSKQKNLQDARWMGYWSDYSLSDALALFPNSEPEDFDSAADSDSEDFYHDPYGGRYSKTSFDTSVEWANKNDKKVRVYNFQWYEIESYWRADNPINNFNNPEAKQQALNQLWQLVDESDYNDDFNLKPTDEILTFDLKTKSKLVGIFGKYINPIEFKRKCYYTAVVSGSKVFHYFKSVCQSAFSIQFKTGTYDNSRGIWIGMVNNMMQPQIFYNKALTELMFTIAANSKGGALVEKNTVEDIQEFEEKYASTSAVIEVKEGALSGGKIQPKGQNIPVTGLDSIITLSDAAISETSGVDKSFLGSGVEKIQSGILYRRRIRQVISSMAKFFDSVSMYQKTSARVDIDFIKIWMDNNAGQMIEMLSEDGTYTVEELNAGKLASDYGIMLQEGMETEEDKQEKAEIISAIGDKLSPLDPNAAKIVYGVALKYLNLDSEDRKKISDAMQPQQQTPDPAYVQQLEEQLKLLSSETNMADVKRKLASAEKDLATIDKIKADTAKALEEAQGKGIENELMITNPVTVTI